jgi:hypothetical protein
METAMLPRIFFPYLPIAVAITLAVTSVLGLFSPGHSSTVALMTSVYAVGGTTAAIVIGAAIFALVTGILALGIALGKGATRAKAYLDARQPAYQWAFLAAGCLALAFVTVLTFANAWSSVDLSAFANVSTFANNPAEAMRGVLMPFSTTFVAFTGLVALSIGVSRHFAAAQVRG